MKKKIIRILGLVFAMVLLESNAIFASDVSESNIPSKNESGVIEPRSLYLATAMSDITNEGEGVLGIYADFTSHAGVEWGQIVIYLERTKDVNDGWSRVKTYTKTFNGSDYPDGKITYAYTEFDVHGLATDYYYRLTCDHKVKTPSGSYEAKTTRTDGVLLTSYPVYRRADEIE